MTLRIGKVYIRLWAVLPVIFLALFNPPEYIGAMLFCALLHEAGHLIAMKILGIQLERIDVMMLGAQIKTGKRLCAYSADAMVYCAGALANLAGALFFYLAYLFYPMTEIMFLIFANLFYAFFNMMPVRGLDGGGFLQSLLLIRFEPEKAWKVGERISIICILIMFFMSLWVISASKTNFSMLFVVIYLFMHL